MAIVAEQREMIGTGPACVALSVPRASFYRWLNPKPARPSVRRRVARRLTEEERGRIRCALHDERFVDLPPAEVYASLLNEGKFLCSISTMYRILREDSEVKERRNQLRHPWHPAPELLASRPNELWPWDITKLKGPIKWVYFYLYMILDVFSRYVLGWMVAYEESAVLAKRLITKACEWQKIVPGQLTIHADRGSSMTSKPVALLLSDLGVIRSHGRPYVSNDNPYSESQFKTLKYTAGFPERFGSIQHARSFCTDFFEWYNTMHHHGSLGLLTPFDVHYGLAAKRTEERAFVLRKAFEGQSQTVRPGCAETSSCSQGSLDQQTQDLRR
jgi:putative transposase